MCSETQHTKSGTKDTSLPYKHCLNCGSELKGMYCHECGQKATGKNPTVRDLFVVYFGESYIWDSNFLRTLWTLIRRPGHLTNEFLAGKYSSYEHPVKFNMFLMFVFITLFLFFSGTDQINHSVHKITQDERVIPGIQMSFLLNDATFADKIKESPRDTIQLYAPLYLAEQYPELFTTLETIDDTRGLGLDKWRGIVPSLLIEDNVISPDSEGFYKFDPDASIGKEEIDVLNRTWYEMVNLILQYFPVIIFLSVPLLSLALRFVQRKNRLPRINHFIFSLHYIAFLELLMMLLYILHLIFAPPVEFIEWIMTIGSCTYLTIAFRRVYQTKTWIRSIGKALFTSVVYLFNGMLMFFVIFIIACFSVAGVF